MDWNGREAAQRRDRDAARREDDRGGKNGPEDEGRNERAEKQGRKGDEGWRCGVESKEERGGGGVQIARKRVVCRGNDGEGNERKEEEQKRDDERGSKRAGREEGRKETAQAGRTCRVVVTSDHGIESVSRKRS